MTGTEIAIAIGSCVAAGVLMAYIRSSSGASSVQVRQLIEKGLQSEMAQDYVSAQISLEKAMSEIPLLPQPDLAQEVTCLVHLGNIYEKLGEPEKAKNVFKQAIANWATLLRTSKLNLIDVDYAVTNLNFGRGTLDVCEFYVDNIVVLREKSLPKGHPDIEMSYKIGANLLRKSGYTKEAEILEQRAT